MKVKYYCFPKLLIALVLLFFAISPAIFCTNVPEPILEYLFNEIGDIAPSTGTNSTELKLFKNDNNSAIAADIRSEDGLGVSGKIGDKALDNTKAIQMGQGEVGSGYGRARAVSYVSDLNNLNSFTIQFWFNAAELIKGSAYVFEKPSTFAVLGDGVGKLSLHMTGKAYSATVFDEVNQWVFVAFTFDGTKTTDNIKVYKGTLNKGVEEVASYNRTEPAGSGTNAFGILDNIYTFKLPFKALVDNFRIFGHRDNADGCLSREQLESLRIQDIFNGEEFQFPDAEQIALTADYYKRNAGESFPIEVTVHVVDAEGQNVDGQRVFLNKVAGPEIFVNESEGVITDNGVAKFTITSRNPGIVVLNAIIDPGYGIESIISEETVQLEFEKPPLVQITTNPLMKNNGDREETIFRLFLPNNSKVDLIIYDQRGREVTSLLKETILNSGFQEIPWDGTANGKSLRTGVYIYHVFTTSIDPGFSDNSWLSGTIGVIN